MAGRPRATIEHPQDWRPVDAERPVPLHLQVQARIRTAIESGRLKPKDRLPNETDLCAIFGVSRTVVRQAVQVLVNEGLLRKRPGQGTFVTRPRTADATGEEFMGFESAVAAKARQMTDAILSRAPMVAPARVAEAFGLAPGSMVLEIRRLRRADNEPHTLVTSWFCLDGPEFLLLDDLSGAPLSTLLAERGFVIGRGRRTIQAAAASGEEAGLLKVKTGAPVFVVESVTFLEDGRPLEYARAVHRADRTRLDVELVRLRTHGAGGERAVYINAVVSPMDE